jgi:hypothetical protein
MTFSFSKFRPTQLLPFLTVVVFVGCASVSIKKICTDDDDKKADGFRFYRPRPYLVIHQPTPVGGGDFIVSGDVESSGNVVSIEPQTLPPLLRDYFPTGSSSSKAMVPFDAITMPDAVGNGQPNDASNEAVNDEGKTKNQSNPSDSNKKTSGSGDNKSTTKPTTMATTQKSDSGENKASVRTTVGAQEPLEKLDDYFSILYLPDFEENYVIKVDSGLFGTGSADLSLRYGWLAEHAQWDSDNREVGEFISQTVQAAIKTAGAVINPVSALPSAATELAKVASSKSANEAASQPTPRVLLRIRYVVEAQPGIYPILKPGEANRTTTLPTTGSPVNPVLLPMPPYTVVAYNFRRVIDIEYVNANPTHNTKSGTQKLIGADLAARGESPFFS